LDFSYTSFFLCVRPVHAFDVLGHPVRCRILELLAEHEQSSGTVAEAVRAEFGGRERGRRPLRRPRVGRVVPVPRQVLEGAPTIVEGTAEALDRGRFTVDAWTAVAAAAGASDEEIEPARQVAFAQYAPGVEA
jgi:hypothetical protein